MKIISHRGNINGVMPEKENRPSYVDCAIQLGYDVEIDIRCINDKLYLGHDTPDYEISPTWIDLRKNHLWFHCKNSEAAYKLSHLKNIKYFCHTQDPFVLVNDKYIWVHDLSMITPNSIIPLLSSDLTDLYFKYKSVYAICTDYPSKIKW
jgi:hypothetical protein